MSGITRTIPYAPNCCNQCQAPGDTSSTTLAASLPLSDAAGFDARVEQVYGYGLIKRLISAVAERISRDVEAGVSPSVLDPEETARALAIMTERYLLDAFGQPEKRPSRRGHEAVFGTLEEIWSRTLYGPH